MKARITKIGTVESRPDSNGKIKDAIIGWGFDCGGHPATAFQRNDGKPSVAGWSFDELRAMTIPAPA
jgi:hypothetical protein